MEGGKTRPPDGSSIIAGVQCQEAVKLLHGMKTLRPSVGGQRTSGDVTTEFSARELLQPRRVDEIIAGRGVATMTPRGC
jgi:hypothetical protein